jgi:hypothetical protein
MKKTPENITAYGVFLTSRSFDLENRAKVNVIDLENSKFDRHNSAGLIISP